MSIVSVLSSKGGAGATLISTNLGLALGAIDTCLLVDLHTIRGCADLLLGLTVERTWLDLLPVASELRNNHLSRSVVHHSKGLSLLAAPNSLPNQLSLGDLSSMLISLEKHYRWVVMDIQSGWNTFSLSALRASHQVLLVTTPDPPALRCTHRLFHVFPDQAKQKIGLVLNQVSNGHPVSPESVATSLGIPLLAALPADRESVSDQIYFGDPATGSFASAIEALANRISMNHRDG
jgi:Flp pilus assembly CpaE family ATPase